MKQEKVYTWPNWHTPSLTVTFDEDICNGCNECVEACQVDVLMPNPVKGKPPIVVYPEECWYGGCCEGVCQREGACQVHLPLPQRVSWKNKETGEVFRAGRPRNIAEDD